MGLYKPMDYISPNPCGGTSQQVAKFQYPAWPECWRKSLWICCQLCVFFQVNHGLQEEWEVELEKLTAKFERELGKRKTSEDVKVLTIKHNKEKEEAKKNLTIKREKKTESIQRKLLEQERAATAALVEKHSKEMMTLIQEKRAQYITEHDEADNAHASPGTSQGQAFFITDITDIKLSFVLSM